MARSAIEPPNNRRQLCRSVSVSKQDSNDTSSALEARNRKRNSSYEAYSFAAAADSAALQSMPSDFKEDFSECSILLYN